MTQLGYLWATVSLLSIQPETIGGRILLLDNVGVLYFIHAYIDNVQGVNLLSYNHSCMTPRDDVHSESEA